MDTDFHQHKEGNDKSDHRQNQNKPTSVFLLHPRPLLNGSCISQPQADSISGWIADKPLSSLSR